MNIGVIYNTFTYKDMLPEEREMRDTGLAIGKLLAKCGHNVAYFDMDDPASIEALCRSHLEAAFDTCERIHDDARGEAYAAALLEYLGIPHTRTASWLISLGVSKERVKSLLAYHQIATPRYQIFYNDEEPLRPGLSFPLFVKGLASENSIGIDEHSLVKTAAELKAKVRQINQRYHQPALVEEYIDGRELTVAILPGEVNRVLPISEIVFRDLPPERRFLDYNAKWRDGSEQFRKTVPVCPAELSESERRQIGQVALHCYNVLGLDSYARIDLRYRERTPYILEINQNPSIGEKDSGYVRTCMRYGLDYAGMIDALLHNAILRSHEDRPVRTPGAERLHYHQREKDLRPLAAARL